MILRLACSIKKTGACNPLTAEVSLQELLDDPVECCVLRAAAGMGRERVDIPVTTAMLVSGRRQEPIPYKCAA